MKDIMGMMKAAQEHAGQDAGVPGEPRRPDGRRPLRRRASMVAASGADYVLLVTRSPEAAAQILRRLAHVQQPGLDPFPRLLVVDDWIESD